ncbi:unnamed protein product [Euphydryas editha]|uniref:Uncharacterized protein n=1 Tax=Euphydryas editha TaxID=104508 RepID=A0AAU9THF9_EUPED|nr:unnamed protein product [Euphydryas editha]
MQRPVNHPMMTCGGPNRRYSVPLENTHGPPRMYNMGPCFSPPAPPQFQPSSCFMTVSSLRTAYPNKMPQPRYDPCFK